MKPIKQYIKTKKSEISETIEKNISFIQKSNYIIHSHSLYHCVNSNVLEAFQGHEIEYDIKRKIVRTINNEYEYCPISTIARIENRQRYFRRLDIKNMYVTYDIKKLHCTHTGVWVKKRYMHIFKKIVKKQSKEGNSIIHCFFPKDYVNKNGDLGLLAYIDKLQKAFEGRIRRFEKQLAQMERVVKIAIENWGDFKKLSTSLSTDFMGFVQLIHRKMHGYLIKDKNTAEAVVKHKNKFKLRKKDWKNDIKRVRFRDFINYLVLKPS